MENKKSVGVGISVIVMKDYEVLLGKRKGSHDSGTWQFPGGKLDFFEESFTMCAKREVREETRTKKKKTE